MSATGRMGVGLVGDSPAAVVLARALGQAGHALIGRSVPPEERADSVDAVLPGVPVLDVETVVKRSELVIIAAEDDALTSLVEQIATKRWCQPGQIVCHLDYRHGLEALGSLADQGVITLWLFPLVPLTGSSVDLPRLHDAWCAVAAPTPLLPIVQALAIEVGMEPLVIEPQHHDAFRRSVQQTLSLAGTVVAEATAPLVQGGVPGAAAALGALLRHAVDQAIQSAGGAGG